MAVLTTQFMHHQIWRNNACTVKQFIITLHVYCINFWYCLQVYNAYSFKFGTYGLETRTWWNLRFQISFQHLMRWWSPVSLVQRHKQNIMLIYMNKEAFWRTEKAIYGGSIILSRLYLLIICNAEINWEAAKIKGSQNICANPKSFWKYLKSCLRSM